MFPVLATSGTTSSIVIYNSVYHHIRLSSTTCAPPPPPPPPPKKKKKDSDLVVHHCFHWCLTISQHNSYYKVEFDIFSSSWLLMILNMFVMTNTLTYDVIYPWLCLYTWSILCHRLAPNGARPSADTALTTKLNTFSKFLWLPWFLFTSCSKDMIQNGWQDLSKSRGTRPHNIRQS